MDPMTVAAIVAVPAVVHYVQRRRDENEKKKQKRLHVWYIHPTEIKGREKEPLAEGGFGKVIKAKYQNRPVAVRKLNCRLDKDELVEFRREIDMWYKLEHPHLLPLLGACDKEIAKPFMVSPFMPNRTLKEYLADSKPLNVDKLRIMSEIASALAYLHQKNIIHGDISTRNVLLDENFHAVVADFGLARTKHISSTSNCATHGHTTAGTLQYMAPKMLDWKNALGSSKETDVFAFGTLFYEVMINGNVIWVTADHQPMDEEQIKGCVREGFRPERTRADLDLPISDDDVWSLIQACWRHVAQDRPSFAQVLSSLLDSCFELAWRHMAERQCDVTAFKIWQLISTESNNSMHMTISTYMVGMCHYLGIGTQLDLIKGWQLINESTTDEFRLAQENCWEWCRRVDCTDGIRRNKIQSSSRTSVVFFEHVSLGSGKHILLTHLQGLCYFHGFGTDQDQNKAVQIFMANDGFAASQTFLGACYYNGEGVSVSYDKAVEWFRKATDQGHADAQYHFGLCIDSRKYSEHAQCAPFRIGGFYVRGVSNDFAEAVAGNLKAAFPGHADDAKIKLLYFLTCAFSLEYAIWYRKAAEQGHSDAQFSLGQCYDLGRGVPKDAAKAVNWYRKAAEQGHLVAESTLVLRSPTCQVVP